MLATQHIKNLRIEHNFTQNYVAHELQVSQKTYSNMECGKSRITIEHLGKLASIYRQNIADFIELIHQNDSEIINAIEKDYPNKTVAERYDDINSNLPFELINQLKARIDDLNKLLNSKDKRIEDLNNKIIRLEHKKTA